MLKNRAISCDVVSSSIRKKCSDLQIVIIVGLSSCQEGKLGQEIVDQ